MSIKTDLEMMQEPMSWPHLVLPLKKPVKDTWPEFGILLPGETTVYLCNMFDIPKNLTACPNKVYPSLEEIISDGWIVD